MIADRYQKHRLVVAILCIMALLLLCLQPFVSIPLGDKNTNVCPLVNNSLSVTNGKVNTPQHTHLFYTMLALSIAYSFLDGCTSGFIDAAVILKIDCSKKQPDFGYQRLFADTGFVFGAIISSIVIDIFPSSKITCYSAVFVVYFPIGICLTVSTLILFHGLSFRKRKAEEGIGISKKLWKTLYQGNILFLFCTIIIMGIGNALFVYYTFLFLKEINAPNPVLGLSIFVAAVASVFSFAFSTRLISFIGGTWRVMALCTLSYTIRYIVLSYLKNLWIILIIQPLHGFGYALFIAATIQYLNYISNIANLTTMYSIMNALHYGLSDLVASNAGGHLYKLIGGRHLFLGYGILVAIWTLFIIIFIYFNENTKHVKDDIYVEEEVIMSFVNITYTPKNDVQNERGKETHIS